MSGPILHYLFEFEHDPQARAVWNRTTDYFVWADTRPPDAPPLTVWELTDKGVIRLPDNDAVMHCIRGGTPHTISHLFGYWRACDADIIFVRNVRSTSVYYALILGGAPGDYKNDAILWVCPKCANILSRHEFATGQAGWNRFWKEEKRLVAEFNASTDLRTCAKCGFLHPCAYTFDPENDSPAEAESREAW